METKNVVTLCDEIDKTAGLGRYATRLNALGYFTVGQLFGHDVDKELMKHEGFGAGFVGAIDNLKRRMMIDEMVLRYNGFEHRQWRYADRLGGDYDYWERCVDGWKVRYDVFCDRNELMIQYRDGSYPVIDGLKVHTIGKLQDALDLCDIELVISI